MDTCQAYMKEGSILWMIQLIHITIVLSQIPPTSYPTAPTQSPVICTSLPSNNNASMNVTDLIHYVQLGNNSDNIVASTAQFYLIPMLCNNTDGCSYQCLGVAACFGSVIDCQSRIGCNIKCKHNQACGTMKIYAQQNIDTSININIICYENACPNMNISVNNIQSVNIHCLESGACSDMTVLIKNMSSKGNTNTSINCYAFNACNNLNIIADGPLTHLNMYQYSSGVLLNNNVGYFADYNTVTCNSNNYFVEFIFVRFKNITQLIRNLWLPCQDVVIHCLDTNGYNAKCQMQYEVTLDTHGIHTLKDNNTECIKFRLKDITHLSCIGNCTSSPTRPPTNSPSLSPTQIPSLAPTLSPVTPPTTAPSLAPIINPTLSPSNAPITPTLSPTNAPTISPTISPTTAPTYSPTQAPTRYPTQLLHYNFKIDIIYVFWNLNEENYDFVLNYSSNTVIQHMEEIIESGYFDEILLPEFKRFNVKINRDEFTRKLLYHDKMMFIKAKILFFKEYAQYLLVRSNDVHFINYTTNEFHTYFNNPILKFAVANSSSLVASLIYPIESQLETFWIVFIVLFSCFVIVFCIYWARKMYIKKIQIPNSRKKSPGGLFVEVNTETNKNSGEELENGDDMELNEKGENMNENDEGIQLNDHRQQFKKASDIIKKQQKKGKNIDYNEMVILLQENNINYTVIEDVLCYSKQSGLFAQNDRFDGDQVQMMTMDTCQE